MLIHFDGIAILTAATCGHGCWHAREDVCRCSCGGQNHGILGRGGERPTRTCRIQGALFELVAVVPGRSEGECWIDADQRTRAARHDVIVERFPGVDEYAYGDYRPRKTYPVQDRKIGPAQAKWPEVSAVPNAYRLVWAQPAGTDYARRTDRGSR
jgi:hypothetical protein